MKTPPQPHSPTEAEARLALRQTLGRFATGVTVVTTRTDDGQPLGLTVNSFNAVSLQPPLVLWSLRLDARSLPVFQRATHYVINVLSADQADVCDRFARGRGDRFAQTPHRFNPRGMPLLKGALAWLECRHRSQYEEGDHLILVGEVEHHAQGVGEPLVFQAGRLGGFSAAPSPPAADTEHLPFVDDYLAYLLARVSQRVSAGFHTEVTSQGLSVLAWRVLASLAGHGPMPVRSLCEHVLAQQPTVTKLLDRLQAQGLVQRLDDAQDRRQTLVQLSTEGAARVAPLLAKAKAHEAQVLQRLGSADAAQLKRLLQKLLPG